MRGLTKKGQKLRTVKQFIYLLLTFWIIAACLLSSMQVWAEKLGEESSLYRDFKHEPIADCELALELTSDSLVWEYHADRPLALGVANELMTFLLASEKLELDWQVKIDEESWEAAGVEPEDLPIALEPGREYPVDLLLSLQIFYHSKLASLCLAKSVAANADDFVTLMNQRARQLGMAQTEFKQVLGSDDLQASVSDADQAESSVKQYSTLQDLAKLVRRLYQSDTFQQILSKKDFFYTLQDNRVVNFKNPFRQIWSGSPDITGTAYTSFRNGIGLSFVRGKQGKADYLVFLAKEGSQNRANTLVDFWQELNSYYEISPLASQGQTFPATDKSRDGQSFGLKFIEDVYYLHPRSDDFLRQDIRYVSLGPLSRPIQRTNKVGYAVFTLKDKRQIQVALGPDKSLLTSNSLLDKLLDSMQQNKNLAVLILSLSVLLLGLLIYRIRQLAKQIKQELALAKLAEEQRHK